MSIQRALHAALLRLSRDLGDPDVLDLPIDVVPGADIDAIACTGGSSIYLSEEVVRIDPLHLEVYIAHEVFHDVIPAVEHMHEVDAKTLNDATDYAINIMMYDHLGYDVRKVKIKGLFNAKFRGKSVQEIVEVLKNKASVSNKRFSAHQKHPVLQQVANRLKDRLGIRPAQLIKTEGVDEFYVELLPTYDSFDFRNLPRVDPEDIVRSLWVLHFSPLPEYDLAALGKRLSTAQSIYLSLKIDHDIAQHDAAMSMFMVRFLLRMLNNERSLVRYAINKAEYSLTTNDKRMKEARAAKRKSTTIKKTREAQDEINRLNKQKISIERRIARLKAMPALKSVLTNHPGVLVKARKSRPSLANTIQEQGLTPKFDTTDPLVVLIRQLQKLFGSMAALKELYEDLAAFTKDLATNEPEDSSGESHDPREEEGDDGEDVEVEGDEDAAPGATGPQLDEDDLGDNAEADGTDEVIGLGDVLQEAAQQSGVSIEHGNDADKSSGANNKLQVLEELESCPNVIRTILKHAMEFGEKLVIKPTTRISDGMLDKTLTYGNDLSKVSTSELGRLSSEFTRLSFLVDLANSNLLQYSDVDPRRPPLILVLDCSGSMSGHYYEVAAGFCLCMIRMLTTTKQSVALIKFSQRVTDTFIWEKNKCSLLGLLKALATPSFGGTNFDAALHEAIRIHKRMGWQRSQVLLISDAGDRISPSVVAAKPSQCKITAVLVNQRNSLKGVDECVNVKRNGMTLELLRTGNRLL